MRAALVFFALNLLFDAVWLYRAAPPVEDGAFAVAAAREEAASAERKQRLALQRRLAERLLASHQCAELKRALDDGETVDGTLRSAYTDAVARCRRARTLDELIDAAEDAPDEVTDGERLRLVTARGAQRPRALRLLGHLACARNGDAARATRRMLPLEEQRWFNEGCMLLSGDRPLDDGDP